MIRTPFAPVVAAIVAAGEAAVYGLAAAAVAKVARNAVADRTTRDAFVDRMTQAAR